MIAVFLLVVYGLLLAAPVGAYLLQFKVQKHAKHIYGLGSLDDMQNLEKELPWFTLWDLVWKQK